MFKRAELIIRNANLKLENEAIEKENARIINLIGQKGIICREEYRRISQKTLDKSLELS